jgi:saccharopepsin
VHLVRLDRRPVRFANEACVEDAQRSYYVGHVLVGSPQRIFRVGFDTTLGQVLLPSTKCRSVACMERRRYCLEASTTARGEDLVQPSEDVVTVGLAGEGSAKGDLLQERICLPAGDPLSSDSAATCTHVGIVSMTEMTDIPFRPMPHDGVVGLGLDGLPAGPAFSLLRALGPSMSMRPQFGVRYGASGGEIAFGGYNPAHLAPGVSLAWSPVERPQEGLWQVNIRAVRIGNRTLDYCSGARACRGVVDTSSARLGIPAELFPLFHEEQLAGCQGPLLHLDLNGATLTLRPEDYLADAASSEVSAGAVATEAEPPRAGCTALLTPLRLPKEFAGTFVLGEPVLRRYYTVFDGEEPPRIGFGLAAAEQEERQLAPARGPEPGAAAAVAPPAAAERVLPELQRRLGTAKLPLEEESSRAFAVRLFQAFDARQRMILLACSVVSFVSVAFLVSLPLMSWLARPPRPGDSKQCPPKARPVITLKAVAAGQAPGLCVICLGEEREVCLDDAVCQLSSAGTHAHKCECAAAGATTKGREQATWCSLRCGHKFHDYCIVAWLERSQRCPICRCDAADSGAREDDADAAQAVSLLSGGPASSRFPSASFQRLGHCGRRAPRA